METKRRKAERKVGRAELDELMREVFGGESHAQRVASLSDGVDGVLHATSLGVRAIGHGLAVANGLAPRHAIKQVDRLLSNPKLMREEVARCWVRFVVAKRKELFVDFDWREFEDSDQSMLVLGTQTEHGRSTPLVWKTVTHSEIKDQRNAHEDELLGLLTDVLPRGVRVTVAVLVSTSFTPVRTEADRIPWPRPRRGATAVEARSGALDAWVTSQLGEDDVVKHGSQLLAGHPQQDLRAREPLLDKEVVAVQRDTPMAVGRPRDHGLGEVAGQLLWRVDAAPGASQDLNRNRGEPLILQEPLMGGRVVELDEGLMALLEFHRRAGQGELIVIEAPLDVKGCFHPVLIALALSADDRLMLDL